MKKQHLKLSDSDKIYLQALLSKGTLQVRKHKRAVALLELDKEKTYQEVSRLIHVGYSTISGWVKKYKSEGLSFLDDKPRSGRPIGLSGEDHAKITALACSDPPEGYGRWSLRLLADKLVELDIVESISFKQVGIILKKMNLNLTEKDNGVSGK
jgi:transposase